MKMQKPQLAFVDGRYAKFYSLSSELLRVGPKCSSSSVAPDSFHPAEAVAGKQKAAVVRLRIADCSRLTRRLRGMNPWIPESAFTMVENHNPDINESKPLTTETEVLAPEATADHTGLSSESTSTQPHETAHESSNTAAQHAPPAAAARASADHGTVATVTAAAGDESEDDLNYDAADFAAALANFDR